MNAATGFDCAFCRAWRYCYGRERGFCHDWKGRIVVGTFAIPTAPCIYAGLDLDPIDAMHRLRAHLVKLTIIRGWRFSFKWTFDRWEDDTDGDLEAIERLHIDTMTWFEAQTKSLLA